MIKLFNMDVKRAYGRSDIFSIFKAIIFNPCTQACFLIRLSQSFGKLGYVFFRQLLIMKHGIDVGYGLKVGGGLSLPHPLNIVIGKGVVIGDNATIYQCVTLGKSQGYYPVLADSCVVFPNSVLVGKLVVESSTRIGAMSFLKGVPDE